MYNNFIIISGAIACALLIDYTGRRAWFCGALFIASLALIILGIMGANTIASVFLMTSITLFCITSLNLAIYLYTPEVFPTPARGRMRDKPRMGPRRSNDRAPCDWLGNGRQPTQSRVPWTRSDRILYRTYHSSFRHRDPAACAGRGFPLTTTGHGNVRFVGIDHLATAAFRAQHKSPMLEAE
jgi:hypothetical protein